MCAKFNNKNARIRRKKSLGLLVGGLGLVVLLGLGQRTWAGTLILTEPMKAGVRVRAVSRISLPSGVNSLTYRLIRPPDTAGPVSGQRVFDYRLKINPKPGKINRQRDKNGNLITILTFNKPRAEISVSRTCEVKTVRRLDRFQGDFPYPLPEMPRAALDFLAGSKPVQTNDRAVRNLSRFLVRGATRQDQVVSIILNWITDNIRLDPSALETDAVSVLKARRGSGEGLAHLAAAMLRQMDIPVRVVAGLTSDKSWQVRFHKTVWSVNRGQGRHVWIEVYYPWLGWVECDPLLTRRFVPAYYVRLGAGLDAAEASLDGSLSWQGGVGRPEIMEDVRLDVVRGAKVFIAAKEWERPGNLVMAASLNQPKKGSAPALSRPFPAEPFRPARLTREQALSFPCQRPAVIGFDGLALSSGRFIRRGGPHGGGSARPVNTGKTLQPLMAGQTPAQAFILDTPLELEHVSLALGRASSPPGRLRVGIMRDNNGLPGEVIAVSRVAGLGNMDAGADIGWVVFPFKKKDNLLLLPGRYWLRPLLDGQAGFSWAYCLGNPLGRPDDTRNGSAGQMNSAEIMNRDFYFSLKGQRRMPRRLGSR
ncbi:MAG: transglutaminase domain-containing protein [Thermodesulfobacteriota bacterium]|nr:transglutaminase domain-containing protein [Thermodesulfobacteriota bacterium]